jgi:hypothetical protein
MASRLTFSGRGHTYALDGTRVPGVTTVISLATSKPGLVWAAAREAGLWCLDHLDQVDAMGREDWIQGARFAHRRKWDAAGRRGTFLHEAAVQLVNGEPLTPWDHETGEEWPEDVTRAAGQLARFMDDFDVEPLACERPVYNENDLWAGTLDLAADIRMPKGGRRRLILDYKTGDSGVYPEHAMQQAAYRHATHIQVLNPDGSPDDMPMIETDGAAIVWVQPDFYELRPVRADAGLYDVFVHMLPVAAWASEKAAQSVFEPLPIPPAEAS